MMVLNKKIYQGTSNPWVLVIDKKKKKKKLQ